MKWYEFSQNNSGGEFDVNDNVCHRVFIQSENEEKATEKAVKLGMYFDGVAGGMDCECCGDRWSNPCELTFPYKYTNEMTFETVEDFAQYLANEYGFTVPDCYLYYGNGKKKKIFTQREEQ